MGSPPSANPNPNPQPVDAPLPSVEAGSHDFEAQKRIHQQIRNDPDYDDWEYGTEPLPHEAWVAKQASQAASSEPPASA
ncbi:MAG: hypothetical protein VKP63_06415 [Cyanobacteriota bacterium]|nr:hypothetical protein [Cyanobacteriota bacterium]